MNAQQQFPLPASMPPSSVAAVAASMRNSAETGKDPPEDLRIPTSSPFLSRGALPGAHPMPGHPGMGSALLDTYLSMIAAAGGDSASMAAALGSFPGRAAAFAAQAAAASQMAGGGNPDLKANGKEMEERSISEDREDEAMPSDADISDNEEDKDDEKNEAGLAAAVEAAAAAAATAAAAGEDN